VDVIPLDYYKSLSKALKILKRENKGDE